MRAVVLANGDRGGSDRWGRERLAQAKLVIAADGGAETAVRWGRPPDLVVGDLDSIGEKAKRRLEEERRLVEAHAREKDQTDTELALVAAVRLGASSIEVLGALGGGRLDHALANVFLLALPALSGMPVALLDERHEVRLIRGPGRLAVNGKLGDVATLLPVSSTVTGVTTRGLRYALREGVLHLGSSRGVSNEVTGRRPAVKVLRGRLLVVVHRG